MVRRHQMFIKDLTATLWKKDTKVLRFSIVGKRLIEHEVFDEAALPASMRMLGVSYFTINDFFKYRVCIDGCMWIDDYLSNPGLRIYDFEQIVRRLEGKNNIDDYRLEDIA